MAQAFDTSEVNDNDKLMGLLGYLIPIIVPLIMLLSESSKNRKFQRYHAINSLLITGAELILGILASCISVVTAGIGSLCFFYGVATYGYRIYLAIKAYQGNFVEVIGLTQLAKNWKWL